MNPSIPEQERTRRFARKLRAELGPDIVSAIEDPLVVEILINPVLQGESASNLWVESLDRGMEDTHVAIPPAQVENIICTVATLLGTSANREAPILEGELPYDGSRFEGFLPPVVSTPALVIRKRACVARTLDAYVSDAVMTPDQRDQIRHAVEMRQNLLVVGGAGSGKTTLVNAILKEMVLLGKPGERFVVLEDTIEIQSDAKNTLQLRTSVDVDMNALLRATLRARPDRIVIGETRGKEALTLLKAWSTGHPGGVATLHANSAVAALGRLDQLVQEADVPSQPELIAETVDLVVHLQREGLTRRVSEVVAVRGFSRSTGEYVLARVA